MEKYKSKVSNFVTFYDYGDNHMLCRIVKDTRHVLVIWYHEHVIVYGGHDYNIAKIYKKMDSFAEAYNKMMYIVGKLCKKHLEYDGLPSKCFSDESIDFKNHVPWVKEDYPEVLDELKDNFVKNET